MVWSPVNGKSPGITSGFPAAGQDSEISLRHQHILQQSQLSNEIRNPNLCRRSLQNIMNRVGLHNGKKVGVTWIWVNILQNWGSNGSRKWVLVFHKPSISSKPSIWVCLKIGDPQFQLSSCSLLYIIHYNTMVFNGHNWGYQYPRFSKGSSWDQPVWGKIPDPAAAIYCVHADLPCWVLLAVRSACSPGSQLEIVLKLTQYPTASMFIALYLYLYSCLLLFIAVSCGWFSCCSWASIPWCWVCRLSRP